MSPETLVKLKDSLHDPLRGALNTARAANIDDFDLDKFVHEVAQKKDCGLDGFKRDMIYVATASIPTYPQPTQNDDNVLETPKQINALKRFRIDPDLYKTKGEASGVISACIASIEALFPTRSARFLVSKKPSKCFFFASRRARHGRAATNTSPA